MRYVFFFFFFQAEDGIRDKLVTGVQTCALPILAEDRRARKRQQSAVRELELSPIPEHRREPAANAASVQLHRLLGTKTREDDCPLLLGQPSEIQLKIGRASCRERV